jgi:hypothetical protein
MRCSSLGIEAWVLRVEACELRGEGGSVVHPKRKQGV